VVRLSRISPNEVPAGARDDHVKTAEEERALGKGWVNLPNEFPKSSRMTNALRSIKPWWTEWNWLFAAIAVVVGSLGGIAGIYKAMPR
jgi:hypothetical protein